MSRASKNIYTQADNYYASHICQKKEIPPEADRYKQMNSLLFFLSIGFTLVLLGACSSSKEATDKNNGDEDGIYIFDEVPDGDSFQIDNAEEDLNFNFFVQIAAFTTKASAEDFVEESANALNNELEIKYSSISNLYTVRIKELFNGRIKAEEKRNELWQDDKFKDAWIVKEHK